MSPAQLALAWVLREPGVAAIPKAARPEHVRADVAASRLPVPAAALDALDAAFPPPTRKRRLEII